MKDALIVMDYINEISHKDGKFKGKGYYDFIENNNTFSNINNALKVAREKEMLIIFVKVGFSKSYTEQPKNSLLFGKANEFKALQLGEWATEFNTHLDVNEDDHTVIKSRISPFFGTNLESYLRSNKIDTLYLAGVATDLVVESAARDAHDRDYNVHVLEDCCAAGNMEDHEKAITTIKKVAHITSSSQI